MLEFVSKKTAGHRCAGDKDVLITFSRNPKDDSTAYLSFRNGSADKIAPNTGAAVWAINGSRLYFKEESPRLGYRFSKNSSNRVNNKYMKLRSNDPKINKWFAEHEGEYDLVYDAREELWCIDTKFVFNSKIGRI